MAARLGDSLPLPSRPSGGSSLVRPQTAPSGSQIRSQYADHCATQSAQRLRAAELTTRRTVERRIFAWEGGHH